MTRQWPYPVSLTLDLPENSMTHPMGTPSANRTRGTTGPRLEALGEPVLIADNEPYCAFTDLARLEDGTLLAVYDAAQDHLDPGMRIELRRSRDDGRTWSKPEVVVEPIDAGYGVRDPHIAALRDGRLILSWFSYREKNVYSSIATHTRYSDDRGRTSSDPVTLHALPLAGMAMSNRALELRDGRLLLSVHGRESDASKKEICGVIASPDRGESWPEFYEICRQIPHQGMECELAQLDDGHIVALIRRTAKKLGLRSVSEDGGKTWSEPEDVPVGHAPGLLADGERLLVNHRTFPDGRPRENTTGEGRGNYQGKGTVISLSLDAGRSFVDHLPLGFPIRTDFGGDTAYGGIVKLPNGDYYTTYYSTTPEAVHVFGQRFRVGSDSKAPEAE